MRLPARIRRQVTSPEVSLAESSIETDLYSTISSAGFAPDTFSPQTGYTQLFVASADGVSVASSTYNEPCRPSSGNGSFYSGVLRKGDTFAVERTLADLAEPLFFYSPNDSDCAVGGQVGVLNPSLEQTLDGYLAKARDYGRPGVAPSSPAPFGGTLRPVVAAVLPDPEPSAAAGAGVIVGATLGAIFGLALLLGLGWFAWSRYARRRGGAVHVADETASPHPPEHFDVPLQRTFSDMSERPGRRIEADPIDEEDGDLGAMDMRRSWSSCEKVAIGTMSVIKQ